MSVSSKRAKRFSKTLNKNDTSDRNIIGASAGGYTNLELYLTGLFPNGTPLPGTTALP